MNKNFDLDKAIILTKDYGYFGAGSTGWITAYLPEDDVIAVNWRKVFVPTGKEDDVVKNDNGDPVMWITYKPFDCLNDYAEVVENDGEYEDLVKRMGWDWID